MTDGKPMAGIKLQFWDFRVAMKQVLQDLKTGETFLEDVPRPKLIPDRVLVRTRTSLISAGTERMLLEFGRGNLISKAKQQPDKVRQAFEKMRTDGVLTTIDAINAKLNQPLPLGYSNVGEVIEANNRSNLKKGDRIVSNGHHAEFVLAAERFTAKVPDSVSDEAASFTVLGAVALQGVRLAKPTIGECFVVIGLGLLGLLTVQILRASGCRVIGIDTNAGRLKLANSFGAETIKATRNSDPVSQVLAINRGQEVDGVLIAAATSSNAPISQAANMCRKRGRIVLLGVVGLSLSRADFYEKELTFQVSCSYGPGRHDPAYEEKGQDYPIGFVRWTAQRNFEAILQMLADGSLDVEPMISHRFQLADVKDAYDVVGGKQDSLGILLDYPSKTKDGERNPNSVSLRESLASAEPAKLAFIGAGNYASSTLMPAFQKTGAEMVSVVSQTGVSSVNAARKFEFREASTDPAAAFSSGENNTVIITTRHDSHAPLVVDALGAGKHVFVEKPLALTLKELRSIEKAYGKQVDREGSSLLMVGFNRRFSPLIQTVKNALDDNSSPKTFVMTINAGDIPGDHWTQDLGTGGGRIIGEACHFIDLLRYLAECEITSISAVGIPSACKDTVTIQLEFADGSIGTVHYFANGNKGMSKERLEVFCDGAILQLDNFKQLKSYGWSGVKGQRLLKQDKGQAACAQAFVDAIRTGGVSPIPIAELLEVSKRTIEAANQIKIAGEI